MEHRGRRLKNLLKGVGKDKGEHEVVPESQPVMQSISPRPTTSNAALRNETTGTRQSISDEPRRPRGTKSLEASLKPLPNTPNEAPVLSLNSVGSDLSENLGHLTIAGKEPQTDIPGHVRYSEEVADRNIEAGTLAQYPDLNQKKIRSSQNFDDSAIGHPNAIQPPKSAASQTRSQSGQEVDHPSVTEGKASTAELYDRKFSESTRANKASDVYVRAGRKPTGHISRSGGSIYDSEEDEEADEDDVPRELRRKPVESSKPAHETLRATDSPNSPTTSTSRHDRSLVTPLHEEKNTIRAVNRLSSSSASSYPESSESTSPATHESHHAPALSNLLHGGSINESVDNLNSPADEKLGEGDRSYLVHDSQQAVDLASVVDLSNTIDTDKTIHFAPAVTHETIHPEVYNIREEEITREIHTHDVYHRIQPIMETEILPARHFIYNQSGEKVEVKASDVPGRTTDKPNWAINTKPKNWQYPFTARFWSGTEGDATDIVGDDGIRRTETTWVHPPVVGNGGLADDGSHRMPGGYYEA